MSSGQTLFVLTPQDSNPSGSNFASLDTMIDASTPVVVTPVLDFDGAADESADWFVTMPANYNAGGLTFSYKYAVDGADVDIVELEFRVITLADLDILTADLGIDTATSVAVQDTPATTPTNKLNVTTTGNLSHANAGSPSPGDRLIIRATRDVSAATNTDDLQLLEILVTET